MEAVKGEVKRRGGVTGTGTVFAHQPQRRQRAGDAALSAQGRRRSRSAEEPFEAGGQKFNRGSFIIHERRRRRISTRPRRELGLQAYALAAAPTVQDASGARAARRACMHTWLSTQTEGWWRQAFDLRHMCRTPTSARSTSAKDANLNAKYDVILFPPVGRASAQIVINGAADVRQSDAVEDDRATPNLGKEDSTDDMRPGLGWEGLMHLQQFVRDGGLLITVDDSAEFASSNT